MRSSISTFSLYSRSRATLAVLAALALLSIVFPLAAQQHEHGDHAMTPEMFDELREKIPLYREYTDEQIIDSMNRMGPNFSVYLSETDVDGNLGILGLGHGFGDQGNQEFQNSFGEFADTNPTAVGLGMAMMTSTHIQSAIDQLVEAGATIIIVVPATTVQNGSLLRQWEYIFDERGKAEYLSVPRIEAAAAMKFTETPTAHPLMATFLRDYALELSTDPANEVVALVSHGPEDAKDNKKELKILREQAKRISESSEFSAVRAFTLQDDAPSEVRSANVDTLRGWVEQSIDGGKRVIVLTNLLVKGSVHAKIERDLTGLDYAFNQKGLMLHPQFTDWTADAIEAAVQ